MSEQVVAESEEARHAGDFDPTDVGMRESSRIELHASVLASSSARTRCFYRYVSDWVASDFAREDFRQQSRGSNRTLSRLQTPLRGTLVS